MKLKINLILLVIVCIVSNKAIAQSPVVTNTKLPAGTFISNGKLTAKEGYKFELSADKKSAALINARRNVIEGTFTCGCTTSTPSGEQCDIQLKGNRELSCIGTCSCRLDAEPTGGKKFTIILKK